MTRAAACSAAAAVDAVAATERVHATSARSSLTTVTRVIEESRISANRAEAAIVPLVLRVALLFVRLARSRHEATSEDSVERLAAFRRRWSRQLVGDDCGESESDRRSVTHAFPWTCRAIL